MPLMVSLSRHKTMLLVSLFSFGIMWYTIVKYNVEMEAKWRRMFVNLQVVGVRWNCKSVANKVIICR